MVALGGGGHAWLLQGGHAWLLLGGGGMHGCSGGVCVVAPGGMRGCSWGVCVVAPGERAWLLQGECVHGCSGGWGCAWLLRGGGIRGFFDEIRSMSGRYASYWNAF